MNLKDPEVYRLARELAERRGTSMTAAVRAALVEAVEREPYLSDEDLYDERGLPR